MRPIGFFNTGQSKAARRSLRFSGIGAKIRISIARFRRQRASAQYSLFRPPCVGVVVGAPRDQITIVNASILPCMMRSTRRKLMTKSKGGYWPQVSNRRPTVACPKQPYWSPLSTLPSQQRRILGDLFDSSHRRGIHETAEKVLLTSADDASGDRCRRALNASALYRGGVKCSELHSSYSWLLFSLCSVGRPARTRPPISLRWICSTSHMRLLYLLLIGVLDVATTFH